MTTGKALDEKKYNIGLELLRVLMCYAAVSYTHLTLPTIYSV